MTTTTTTLRVTETTQSTPDRPAIVHVEPEIYPPREDHLDRTYLKLACFIGLAPETAIPKRLAGVDLQSLPYLQLELLYLEQNRRRVARGPREGNFGLLGTNSAVRLWNRPEKKNSRGTHRYASAEYRASIFALASQMLHFYLQESSFEHSNRAKGH